MGKVGNPYGHGAKGYFNEGPYHEFTDSKKETEQWYEQNSNLLRWEQSLSNMERVAINTYWQNPSHLLPEQWIMLEDCINRFKLNQGIVTYHGAEDTTLLGQSGLSLSNIGQMIGSEFTTDRVLSTASTPSKLTEFNNFGYGIQYRIEIPKGSGIGAYIGGMSDNIPEREFLISSGHSFIVRSAGIENIQRKDVPVVRLRLNS